MVVTSVWVLILVCFVLLEFGVTPACYLCKVVPVFALTIYLKGTGDFIEVLRE